MGPLKLLRRLVVILLFFFPKKVFSFSSNTFQFMKMREHELNKL